MPAIGGAAHRLYAQEIGRNRVPFGSLENCPMRDGLRNATDCANYEDHWNLRALASVRPSYTKIARRFSTNSNDPNFQ